MTRMTMIAAMLMTGVACVSQPMIYGTRWEFERDAEGWQGRAMGLEVEEGTLRCRIEGYDPWITGPEISLEGARFPFIQIKLRCSDPDIVKGAFYWRTEASPSWAEPVKKIQFPITSDGQWHTYDRQIGAPSWEGKVLQLRFDPEPSNVGEGSTVEIDHIRVYGLAWDGELAVKAGRVQRGEAVEVSGRVTAMNRELAGARQGLRVPRGLTLIQGTAEGPAETVEMGGEAVHEWQLRAETEGLYRLVWTARAEGVEPIERSAEVLVTAATPDLGADRPEGPTARRLDGGHIVLGNRCLRLAFVKSGTGYLHAVVDVWDDGWQRMGSAYPLGELVALGDGGRAQEMILGPTEASVDGGGSEARVRLTASATDSAGGQWRYELTALLGEGATDVQVTAALSAHDDRKVLRFAGPVLHGGDGSFEADKDEAMFPGLEWLIGDEKSSSTLDIAPPGNIRYVPHPYKVTVPVMCVEHSGRVLGLAWDPLQKWDGEHICPLAQFCSPNWLNNRDDHLMGLFVPTIPQWVMENETRAAEPYHLAADRPITLRSVIVTGTETSCLQQVWRYFDIFGEFRAQAAPLTDEEEMALADETYLEGLWKPEEASWIYCFPFSRSKGRALPASNHYFSRFAQALLTDSILRKDRDARERIRRQLDTALEAANEGNAEWYVRPNLAFRVGWTEQALLGAEHHIAALIDGQRDDGSWGGFKPTPKTEQLGPAGKREVGFCAPKAYELLKYARITGNQDALAAGLKALAFMRRFEVPRAAQTWECPVHSPDIYAAYQAIMPNLEAYRITGEKEHLDRAVYWAETGLPFVYIWGAADRPVMKGGSIAIFGASFFTGNWIGRPVQWNGMEYSYGLLKLAEYDHSRPWAELAKSIMRSGMWQQEKDDSANAKGAYTDNWDLPTNVRCTSFLLSPWWILLNLHTLRGYDPDVQTAIIETEQGAIHLSSGAQVAASVDDGNLSVSLEYAPGHSVSCLIAGIAQPDRVMDGGGALVRTEDLSGVDAGWTYLPERGFAIVKTTVGETGGAQLLIPDVAAEVAEWELGSVERPAYKTVRQLEYEQMPLEIARRWEFASELEGEWQAFKRDDMSEPQIVDGMLVATATGPDPQMWLPVEGLDASRFPVVTLEMSVDRGSQFELYYATEDAPGLSGDRSLFTPVRADGELHRYTADLTGQRGWEGEVVELRFDPVGPKDDDHIGATIKVKRIVISNKPL